MICGYESYRGTTRSCSRGRCVSFPTSIGADVSKTGVLSLGSPSFSLDHLKEKDLAEEFGSGTMYEHVAPHAWTPANFPRTETEAKVMYAPWQGTLNGHALLAKL